MPTYNYTCLDCGETFTARLSYSEVDHARPACPECRSTRCDRGLSKVNIAVHNGGSDYRLTRDNLETAIGMSNAMSAGEHSHSHGCGGCSGGSCATCGH